MTQSKHFTSLFVALTIVAVIFIGGCVQPPTEEELKEKLTVKAEAVMSKDPCEATLDDVRHAFELAGEAQKIPGMETTADQLIDWAAAAFKGYAARRVAAGAGAKERTELAAEAQKIPRPGMDQLAEDLMAGKPIASPCIEAEAWEGTLDAVLSFIGLKPEDHVEFSFTVDKEGRITGEGTGKFVSCFKVRVDPLKKDEVCEECVENPIKEVKVSGKKIGKDFLLSVEWVHVYLKAGCGVTPKPAQWAVIRTIPAQDGAQLDCSGSGFTCNLQIHKR